jgi:hypothetical protein
MYTEMERRVGGEQMEGTQERKRRGRIDNSVGPANVIYPFYF